MISGLFHENELYEGEYHEDVTMALDQTVGSPQRHGLQYGEQYRARKLTFRDWWQTTVQRVR